MPSIGVAPLSGRYLSFSEREQMAMLRTQGEGVLSDSLVEDRRVAWRH